MAYSQQMTFCPGGSGIASASREYTKLTAKGDRAARAGVKGDADNFVPKTLNAGISWRYRGFEARVKYNGLRTSCAGICQFRGQPNGISTRDRGLNFKYAFLAGTKSTATS